MSRVEIGKTLRELREAAGLSQVAVAERAGLHWNAVARIERGEVSPSFASVLSLLEGMGHTFEVEDKSIMMEPIVRLMVPCEDARARKGSAKKTDLFGVMSSIFAPADAFPTRHSFAVYLTLTDGHGRGFGRIVVADDETDNVVYRGKEHPFDFDNDPIALEGYLIRVASCPFPKAGLYRIDFVYNNTMIEKCYVHVRETP
jgi:transcriptional regulator with XRE-family HTH domain